MGETRGAETKEVLSLRCKQLRGAAAVILPDRSGRTGLGGGIDSANFDTTTLTCFSSIQVGGLHNAWRIERVPSMGQKEEGEKKMYLDNHSIELFRKA